MIEETDRAAAGRRGRARQYCRGAAPGPGGRTRAGRPPGCVGRPVNNLGGRSMRAQEKIARWLEETGMSQKAAGEAIGFAQSNLSQYLQGKIKQPGWPWMLGVARAMGCDLEWLV